MAANKPEVFVVRHGETAWSLSGQHTSVTDIPLTENGRAVARRLEPILAKSSFSLVLTSPLSRVRETCELAGLGGRATVEPDLMEWNYGEYEGLTANQIHARRPAWLRKGSHAEAILSPLDSRRACSLHLAWRHASRQAPSDRVAQQEMRTHTGTHALVRMPSPRSGARPEAT
jgi:broad specificity phosphatase PhoE